MNIPYVFKRCPKCREWLVANNINFYKMKSGKWGLESQCKECRKSKQKEKYNNNEFKEEKRKRQRDKYHNDDKFREKIKRELGSILKRNVLMIMNGERKKIKNVGNGIKIILKKLLIIEIKDVVKKKIKEMV